MGKGYLLDTNIVIYYLEGLLTPAGKDLVQKIVFEDALTTRYPADFSSINQLSIINPFEL
jgi:predicted nucleic acid-binding protein